MQLWNIVYRTFVCGCLWISLNLMMRKWSPCVIGTKQQHSKVIIGNVDVTPVSVARNLGTCFDFNLNLREQFDKTCKYKFFHLYNMQLIRKYILSQESACTLVHAFIIGRIDFFYPLLTFVNCNACSCTAYNWCTSLQSHNTCAMFVTLASC